MDVLLWAIGICFVIGLVVAAIPALVMTGVVIYGFWPTIVGLVVGVWIWIVGHDNIGMFVILAAMVANFLWVHRMDKDRGSTYDPMAGKTKVYDKSGNIVGYRDKE